MARMLGKAGQKSVALPGNRRHHCADCHNGAWAVGKVQRTREKRRYLREEWEQTDWTEVCFCGPDDSVWYIDVYERSAGTVQDWAKAAR